MPEVREKEVYDSLLRYKGKGCVKVGDNNIDIVLTPRDVHNLGRPDCILWVEISLRVFDQSLKLDIPIPVEAEKNGIRDAIEDLDGFVSRKKYIAEIPMIVVAEAGYDRRTETRNLPVNFNIKQVPIWQLQQRRKSKS